MPTKKQASPVKIYNPFAPLKTKQGAEGAAKMGLVAAVLLLLGSSIEIVTTASAIIRRGPATPSISFYSLAIEIAFLTIVGWSAFALMSKCSRRAAYVLAGMVAFSVFARFLSQGVLAFIDFRSLVMISTSILAIRGARTLAGLQSPGELQSFD